MTGSWPLGPIGGGGGEAGYLAAGGLTPGQNQNWTLAARGGLSTMQPDWKSPSVQQDLQLTPLQLVNASGRGWVWIWNRRIDNSGVDFADRVTHPGASGLSAVDILRRDDTRGRHFRLYHGILTPTATVATWLVKYLHKNFGVALPHSVIRCILDHYRGRLPGNPAGSPPVQLYPG